MNSSAPRLGWFTRQPLLKLAGLVVGLFVLWHLAAYPRGALEARIDDARGDYRIKSAGYPARWSGLAHQKLRDRYGIEFDAEAGCDVMAWQAWYIEGYNTVSWAAIQSRYGDVVRQCYEEAQAEYIANLPESERAKYPP